MFLGRTGIASVAAAGLEVMTFAPAAVAAPKSYTAAEVAKNSTAASRWSIVGKSVYDLTKFTPLHPGGQATAATTLAKYRIGALKS